MNWNCKVFLFLLICLFSLISCNRIFLTSYGIKGNIKSYSHEQLIQQAEKIGINDFPIYQVKPSLIAFLDSIVQVDSNNFSTAKSLFQPLQIITFRKDGELIGTIANCDAGGFPNLKWEHLLKKFPPKGISFSTAIPIVKGTFFNHLKKINELEIKSGTAVTLIVYSHFMGRQNKRFLKKAQHYHKMYAPSTALAFANFDLDQLYE